MNFQLKPRPHMRGNTGKTRSKNLQMLDAVTHALLFVVAWSIVNRYLLFGMEVAIHIVISLVVAVLSGLFAHTIFYMFMDSLEKVKFESFMARIKSTWPRTMGGAPYVTALIVAIGVRDNIPLYVLGLAVIFTEIFVKLVFGGFGNNIFNPAAFAFVFILLAFGGTTLGENLPDIVTSATPLSGLKANGWTMTLHEAYRWVETTGGLGRMLVGLVPGSTGETARLASLIALCYLIYKKALDWVLPIFYLGTIFIITFIYGLIIGAGILYPVIHLLTGGVVFGAVFMATDPVTTPINRQGKMIWAICLALCTLLIRFNASHTEGVALSLLLMNMFVPFIDTQTANITTKNTGKKVLSVFITFVVATVVVIGFTMLRKAFA